MIVMEKEYKLGIGEERTLISNFKNVLIGSDKIQDVGILFTLDQTKDVVSVKKMGLLVQEKLTQT